MALARADLESLLRARQLDRTLTTALPSIDPRDEHALAPSEVSALDARLGGGFPRGQISELIGPRSSGRTSLLLRMMAAATARGELVALVDALDMLDVESAAAAGIDFERLLWIRGHVVTNSGLCRELNQRAIEQAIRAFTLVLQAGNFGLVVFDVAEAPADAVRRLPFTTWLRLQRMVEGSQTACVLVGGEAMARSSAGLTLQLGLGVAAVAPSALWRAAPELAGETRERRREGSELRFSERLFDGIDVQARIVRARAREQEDACVALSTSA
jgi:recombination protein RecA